jgi:hypothetical protein
VAASLVVAMMARRLKSIARICDVLAEVKCVAEQARAAVLREQDHLETERKALINSFNGDVQLQGLFAREIARGLNELSLKAAVLREVRHKREENLRAVSWRLKRAQKLKDRLARDAGAKRARRDLETMLDGLPRASFP